VSTLTQPRGAGGRWVSDNHNPELELGPANVEALRGTLVDFLENALPGFGFHVEDVEGPVDRLVESLVAAHTARSA